MSLFLKILNHLSTITSSKEIAIPGHWLGQHQKKIIRQPAHLFYTNRLQEIAAQCNHENFTPRPLPHDNFNDLRWTSQAITYNLFVRFFSAFDHDQDGKLGEGKSYLDNADGIRETGTLLKTIALLPYLKGLGINTLHLLPFTPIGSDGRKGDMGSPYAIKNHFEIDPSIVDPFIPFTAEEQLMALVEACHGLGIRVVMEFILRTTAKDADWVSQHPEWYYWINEKNHPLTAPHFTRDQLRKIRKVPVGKGEYIEPDPSYRSQFYSIPPKTSISYDQRYVAKVDDQQLVIPSAFADWPPDDPQPPWTDVTYLRFYEEKKSNAFNYIAYNTIRYYDPSYSKDGNINRPLWDALTGIIPYYQQKFGIDGVMIDMGHALPLAFKKELIARARNINPSFAFWDEKFSDDTTTSSEYDAIIGNLWYLASTRNAWEKLVQKIGEKKSLHFFACAETHNSPRYGHGDPKRKKQMWLLLNLIPMGMPFIHQGFELDEWIPVNTGLNIGKKLKAKLAGTPLPLFNKTQLNWLTDNHCIPFIEGLNEFRAQHGAFFKEPTTVLLLDHKEKILILAKKKMKKSLYFVFNFNRKNSIQLPVKQHFNGKLTKVSLVPVIKKEAVKEEKITLPGSGILVLESQ